MVAERQPESKPTKTIKKCTQCGDEVPDDQARETFTKYDQILCKACQDAEEAPVPGGDNPAGTPADPPKDDPRTSEPQEPTGPKDAGGSLTYAEAMKELKYNGKNDEGGHTYLMREEYGVPEGITWIGVTTPEKGGPTFNKLMLPFGAPVPNSREYDEEILASVEANEPGRAKPQEPETKPDPCEDTARIAEEAWKDQPGDIPAKGEKQAPQEEAKKSEPLEVPPETPQEPAKEPSRQLVPGTAAVPQAMAAADDLNNKQIQALTAQDIKKYLNPQLTEAEAYMALQLCKARGLNPWTGDVHIIKYVPKTGPAKLNLITSKYVFISRAETAPDYAGFEAGIIVSPTDKNGKLKKDANGNPTLVYRQGSLAIDGEKIVGAWAKVYRSSRAAPIVAEVSMSEYKRDTKIWKEKPGTMLRKVALVQALREACPAQLSGLYESSEIEGADLAQMKQVDGNPRMEAEA